VRNPTDGHPGVRSRRLKRRLRQGAKLIVIDPRRTGIVQAPHIKADYHLALRPSTERRDHQRAAHVVVTEGLTREQYIAERCELESYKKWKAFVAEERNSPEAVETLTGVPAQLVRELRRTYASVPNGAIYYGLGVTEHSQGTTMVMGIANLAMATGNVGREGVGINPLRGQNNVQGSCDMGSFPHELSGYRHISDVATRELFEKDWGVKLHPEPGLRITNMFEAALDGSYKAMYIQGEDFVQSDPNTHHVTSAMEAMECVIVQDLFLNETANYAHVFFPGSSFIEKDGTFTNAERRISRVRKIIEPLGGLADWEVTCRFSEALGYPMNYSHPSEIMDEIARLTPTFTGVTYDLIDKLGSIQWPCNADAPEGTPTMHIDSSCAARASSSSPNTCRRASARRASSRSSSRRVASSASTTSARRRVARRTASGTPRTSSRFIRRMPNHVASRRTTGSAFRAARRDRAACGGDGAHHPGVVYTTFHFPETGANIVTTGQFGLGDELPRVQGDGGAGDQGRPARRVAEARGGRVTRRITASRAAHA
jgi:formate dehydrogenase major subunit